VRTVFFLLLFTLPALVHSQIVIKGTVVDSSSGKALNPVSIENLRSHARVVTNETGSFQINATVDDYLLFTFIGYKNIVLQVKKDMENSPQTIRMSFKALNLKEVRISKQATEYQIDSAHRATIYEDVFDYKQSKSAMSPITSVYQIFSKKHKDIRHFQEQIVDMEKQKFIDTRYTIPLVCTLTKLPESDAELFMKEYPMDYDYARGASELEIKMWIKYNYAEYLKKKK
jgi:hypothetical protein